MLGREVGEHEPTLPAGEARVVDRRTVLLDGRPPQEEDLQLEPSNRSLARILPPSRGRFLVSLATMAERVLQCDCGFQARAASDETLAAQVARHAREAHGMALSHAQALELAARARHEQRRRASIPRVLLALQSRRQRKKRRWR
jgi:Protein of unknown function (DUF1059)